MNRGFLYGDGFFETIRVFDNQIPLIEFHINRIQDALKIYQLKPTFNIDENFITSLKSRPNELIRINFFRSGKGKYGPETDELAFDYSLEENNEPFFLPTQLDLVNDITKAPHINGKIGLYPQSKPIEDWLSVKSLSSIFYVLAAKYKVANNLDHLIIQNKDQFVCEELVSNLLLFDGEQFIIPSIKNGGINGVTQRFIIRNYGFQVFEKDITFEHVLGSKRIYLMKGSTGISRVK